MASTGAGGLPAGHPAPGAATDEFEWTDLHHALADAGEFLPEAEVLQILDEHPDQANRPYAALFLPAHFAAAFYGTKRVNERVYELFPAAARARTQLGSLPLHLAAHNGHLEATQVWWAVHPDAAEEEDGEGWTPIECAWKQGHWAVADFLLSRTGVLPRPDAAPYDPAAPLAADIQVEKYGAVFDEIDPLSADGCTDGPPEDDSGLPAPGDDDYEYHDEHAAQLQGMKEEWARIAAATPPNVEEWIAAHPNSKLAAAAAARPALRAEWRQAVADRTAKIRASGPTPDEMAAYLRAGFAAQKDEWKREHEQLLLEVPDPPILPEDDAPGGDGGAIGGGGGGGEGADEAEEDSD